MSGLAELDTMVGFGVLSIGADEITAEFTIVVADSCVVDELATGFTTDAIGSTTGTVGLEFSLPGRGLGWYGGGP